MCITCRALSDSPAGEMSDAAPSGTLYSSPAPGGEHLPRRSDGGGVMASEAQKWPDTLWIVRHGQSESNVARKLAEEAARAHIGISVRDVDVQLSALGQEQARAVGQCFGAMPAEQRPTVVLVSPYRRTRQTAELICETAGIEVSRRD